MAIKLADTLAPMADFPAVEAKDVAFNDNKSLQEKYDNGELGGGGGTSITVDTAMSSTSTNPVQNKVIKEYVDSKSVDISADLDNAIQNKTDGIYVEKTKISTDDGNALSEKSNGLFVEDLSNKVNALNIAQKTVNEDLEYFSATGTGSSIFLPASPNYNFLPYLDTIKTNLDSSRYTTQYITLKAGKTYQLSFGTLRTTDSATGSSYHIVDSLGNQIGNRGYTGGSYGDNIVDVIYTPTSDIKINPMIVTNATSKYFPDCSFFMIKEVSRTITIDPVEYVNSESGIEDTPVGEIIRTIGNKTPKHYLMCDGTEYNISEYPYLAQHFKNEFGSYNYFGGDGINTFAVPDLSEPSKLTKISPIMTSYTTPSPYVVTRSSVWNGSDYAWRIFDGVKTGSENYTWISAADELNPWICIDLGTKTKITSFKLWLSTDKNKFPENFTLQGSNDGTNFTNIKSFTNVSSMTQASDGEIEFNLDRVAEYRYYKIYVDTLQITGGATYIRIYEWEMYFKETKSNSYIKYEPTYFIGQINGNEYIEEILDKQSFNMTASGANSIGITKQFTKPITDFDKIEFAYSLSKTVETVKDYAGTYDGVPTNITYTNDNKGFVFNDTSSQIQLQDNAKKFPLTVEVVLSPHSS